MGRHSMNYQPEPNSPTQFGFPPEASIAPPGDPIDPGVPGAPQVPSPDGPSTVPSGPGEPDPSPPVEPPPLAPEEFDDGTSATRGAWHAAGEEAVR